MASFSDDKCQDNIVKEKEELIGGDEKLQSPSVLKLNDDEFVVHHAEEVEVLNHDIDNNNVNCTESESAIIQEEPGPDDTHSEEDLLIEQGLHLQG